MLTNWRMATAQERWDHQFSGDPATAYAGIDDDVRREIIFAQGAEAEQAYDASAEGMYGFLTAAGCGIDSREDMVQLDRWQLPQVEDKLLENIHTRVAASKARQRQRDLLYSGTQRLVHAMLDQEASCMITDDISQRSGAEVIDVTTVTSAVPAQASRKAA